MSLSDVIAGAALLVSIISLVISKRSYDQADRVHEQQQIGLAAQSKSQLLALMSDCRATLNATRVDIGALKAVFDAEPEPVKRLLVNFVGLFTEYLPKIEQALTVVDTDRRSAAAWGGRIALADLDREKARIHDDLRTFEFAASQARLLIATFREKLELAKSATTGKS